MRDQILRQPNRTLLEANEAIQALLFKTQVDSNEVTGEQDPVVKLIDFANPIHNQFHAINQFRVDTPGCVKQFITPDIVLLVNGIPLAVVECKLGGPTCANPMHEAFVQLPATAMVQWAKEIAIRVVVEAVIEVLSINSLFRIGRHLNTDQTNIYS